MQLPLSRRHFAAYKKFPHSQHHGGVRACPSLLLSCTGVHIIRGICWHRMERRFPHKKSRGVVPMLGFLHEVFPPKKLQLSAGNVTSTGRPEAVSSTRSVLLHEI